jgi:hypothetical protein
MSNRNFDFSSIVKILNAQNNANFYNRQQTVVQAQTSGIPYTTELQQFNPQTGNYDADTIATLQAGQQAYYFKGLPITTVLAPQQFTTSPTCIPNVNLVQNGDFATGDFSEWDLQGADLYPADNRIITTTPLPSPAGAVYGYAAGNVGSNATLTQNISTTVGQTYTLSYYLYGGPSSTTAPNVTIAYFSASISGTPITGSIITYTSPPDNPGFGWTLYSFVFTASSISTPLIFTTRHDANFFTLTNISVTCS